VPNEGDSIEIVCGSNLDISGIAEFYSSLKQHLDAGNKVILKADDIDRVDTSALQLLCSFFREATKQGMIPRWESPSQALIDSAVLLGIAELLHLDK
jgi:ABC-type transporter Mla MlaB component